MTRKSKREIERAIENIAPSSDAPREIVVTDRVIPTGWSAGEDETPETELDEDVRVSRTRYYRDASGEWQTEEVNVDR